MNLSNTKKQILNCLFPWKCLGCYQYCQNDYPLCPNCFQLLAVKSSFYCPVCQKRISPNNFSACKTHKYKSPIMAVASPLSYEDNLAKKLIRAFKYQGLISLANPFGQILNQVIDEYQEVFQKEQWIIIPIPLHPRKEKQRGFNQAKLLAQEISNQFSFLYNDTILTRIKNNPAQAQIDDYEKRKENVKNIFQLQPQCQEQIRNQNIILIDDVITTGATLGEAAKLLKINGAHKIIALCLAKG